MSQKERMCASRLYYAIKDPELVADRNACRLLCSKYNATEGARAPACRSKAHLWCSQRLISLDLRAGHETEKRTQILQEMFKSIDLHNPPYIEPPFTCDYVSALHNKLSPSASVWPVNIFRQKHTSIAFRLEISNFFFVVQGYNITLGSGVYMNFGCILLDCNTIEIGSDTMFGPNVQFYGPGAQNFTGIAVVNGRYSMQGCKRTRPLLQVTL